MSASPMVMGLRFPSGRVEVLHPSNEAAARLSVALLWGEPRTVRTRLYGLRVLRFDHPLNDWPFAVAILNGDDERSPTADSDATSRPAV